VSRDQVPRHGSGSHVRVDDRALVVPAVGDRGAQRLERLRLRVLVPLQRLVGRRELGVGERLLEPLDDAAARARAPARLRAALVDERLDGLGRVALAPPVAAAASAAAEPDAGEQRGGGATR